MYYSQPIRLAKSNIAKLKSCHFSNVISDGSPLEIYTDVTGEVILKKYSPVGEMSSLASAYADTLVRLTGCAALVTDTEQVIAVAGPAKKELLHKPLAAPAEEMIQARRSYLTDGEGTVLVCKEPPAAALALFPVVSVGDPMGAVVLLKGEKSPAKLGGEAAETARAAAMFLSRQLEM